MKILGIVVEYNPFHNGHIYHIQKAKELVQPDVTIAIMSGNFVQRGEPAIIDKWQRSAMALSYGVDLVVELPFVCAVQSADYFAAGAIKLLAGIGVSDIVFGSENGNIEEFIEIARAIKENEVQYQHLVSQYMQQGIRYPDACNQALSTLLNKTVTTPNDLLGLSYVKEVINHDYSINMHCIQRTNDFHSQTIQPISSATAIRQALKNKQDTLKSLPNRQVYLQPLVYLEDYFPLLKYTLLTSTPQQLQQLHLVEEGLENLILQVITRVNTMEECIQALTSKRYTRSRIQRMIIHILMHNTKTEIIHATNVDYLRILAMSSNGRQYLKAIKKVCPYKIVTNFSSYSHPALDLEFKATKLYACLFEQQNEIIASEYKNIPTMQ